MIVERGESSDKISFIVDQLLGVNDQFRVMLGGVLGREVSCFYTELYLGNADHIATADNQLYSNPGRERRLCENWWFDIARSRSKLLDLHAKHKI